MLTQFSLKKFQVATDSVLLVQKKETLYFDWNQWGLCALENKYKAKIILINKLDICGDWPIKQT